MPRNSTRAPGRSATKHGEAAAKGDQEAQRSTEGEDAAAKQPSEGERRGKTVSQYRLFAHAITIQSPGEKVAAPGRRVTVTPYHAPLPRCVVR